MANIYAFENMSRRRTAQLGIATDRFAREILAILM